MSKLDDIKAAMKYHPKPVFRICSNCKHFSMKSEMEPAYGGGSYVKESELRCSIGKFKVMKQATCDHHQFQES